MDKNKLVCGNEFVMDGEGYKVINYRDEGKVRKYLAYNIDGERLIVPSNEIDEVLDKESDRV